MRGLQTSYTIRTFNSLRFAVFSGFLYERLIFLLIVLRRNFRVTHICTYDGERVKYSTANAFICLQVQLYLTIYTATAVLQNQKCRKSCNFPLFVSVGRV